MPAPHCRCPPEVPWATASAQTIGARLGCGGPSGGINVNSTGAPLGIARTNITMEPPMKKQILRSVTLAAFAAAPSYAQTMAGDEGTFTITPSFVSAYMFRGVRLGGLSFQPLVEYSKGRLVLGLQSNFPISDKIPGTCDPEFDLTASYSWTIVPDTFTIKPGIALYTYPRADADDGFYKATCEPSLSFGYSLGDMDFAFNYYYDIIMKGATYEFGVNYLIPAKSIGFDIELSALVGKYDWSDSVADDVRKTRNKGSYLQTGVAISYEVSKRSSLNIGWCFAKGTNNYYYAENSKESNPDAIGKGFFNVSYSFTF
jgi:hypothetical protein